MVKYLENKKACAIVFTVCFITYTLLGFTRSAYTAAVAGIIADGVFTKLDAGTISSSFYLTYSAAQFLGSYLTDRIAPFKIVLFALISTTCANIAMSISSSFAVILVARAFCGIAQFGTWPAFLKIATEYLNPVHKRKAMYIMPLGMQTATILSFFIASVVLKHGKWQDLFSISYILLVAITVIYLWTFKYAQKYEVDKVQVNLNIGGGKVGSETKKISSMKLILSSGALLMIIPVMAKSLIASGISSWMPTMIMESYGVSPSFSSTLTAIATLSNLVSVFWVILLYPTLFKNQMFAVGMFFAMTLPILVLLIFVGNIHLALVVISIALVNSLKNAIHQFYTVEIPAAYSKYNKSGMIAGTINAFACVGSMIAGVLFGYTADNFGWSATVASWAVLCLLGAIFSFAHVKKWKRFLKQK